MIEIKGLTKSYGEKTVFENLSFSFRKGRKNPADCFSFRRIDDIAGFTSPVTVRHFTAFVGSGLEPLPDAPFQVVRERM